MGTWAASIGLIKLGRFDDARAGHWSWASLIHGDSVIALQLALAGDTVGARDKVRALIRERGIGTADDWVETVTLVNLVDAASVIGDVDSARLLYERFKDADDWYNVPVSTSGRPLGLAALLLGDVQAARKHLLVALDVASRLHDRPEIARVHLALAGVLFEHFPDQKAAAADHLNTATHEAQAMKMQPLLEECLALKLRFQGVTSSDINTSIDAVARVVDREKPDLRSHAAPDGTVTIMFSDIEGSTEKTTRLGDNAWMQVLREHNAIIREQIKAHGGFEVKSEGDGFMVAFQSARRALDCATAIQKALAERNNGPDEAVRVRMGLHSGEVVKEGEDFFGRNVILAARVASQARGGEILASSVLKALLEGSGVAWGEKHTVGLKGLPGEHEIWTVIWSA